MTSLSYPHRRVEGNRSRRPLLLLPALLLAVGCGDLLRWWKPAQVPTKPLDVRVKSPLLRPGAEFVLLTSQEPVLLTAAVGPDPLDATAEIRRVFTSFDWQAAALSSASDATGEFSPRGSSSPLWTVPPDGGFYRIRCVATRSYLVPKRVHLAAPAGRKAAENFIISGTAEIFVQVPTPGNRMAGGILDGVPLGDYPDPLDALAPLLVRKHANVYRLPSWFYRVDEANRGFRVSPHFTLGDFDMTYDYWQPNYPVPYEYIAFHPRLLDKLETLVDRIQATFGSDCRLVLLAGYRSPIYNEEVKRMELDTTQTSRYSMHLYGRAADFIVDADGDGRMDDLSHDGKVDINDARAVRELVDQVDARAAPGPDSLLGGCGVYPRHDISARKAQTPYVHVDVRGYLNEQGKPARWEMP